jgi:hypothetical protein
MRHAICAAAILLAACGQQSSNNQMTADSGAAETSNVENELIDNPNGTETLRLEGNDSATFVDGELVDVNRAQE